MSYCEGCNRTTMSEICSKAVETNTGDALSYQVGGNHYKDFAIQPVEFITKNSLGFLPGCIIKRICRYNKPSGKGLEDLKKIKHEVDLLIELCEMKTDQDNWTLFWQDIGDSSE